MDLLEDGVFILYARMLPLNLNGKTESNQELCPPIEASMHPLTDFGQLMSTP
jgi:hypothetical protein